MVAGNLVELCGRLAARPRGRFDVSDGAEWAFLCGAVARHGLQGALGGRLPDLGITPPEAILSAWRRDYEGQCRWNARFQDQLAEVGAALQVAGVRCIGLKGATALLTIYQDPGLRELKDLDLLVPNQVQHAAQCLVQLGYQRRAVWNTSEFDPLRGEAGEESSFFRSGSRLVELHSAPPTPAVTFDELWSRSVPVAEAGGSLRILCPTHFLIHTALHYLKHFDLNFAPLKGLVDLMLAMRKYGEELDWDDFWETAERWQVRERVAVVMATLNHHWSMDIPGVPDGAEPLSAEAMVYGRPDITQRRAAHLPGVYLGRMQRLRQIPGARARGHYLFRLLVPEPDNMRLRYGVPEGRSLLIPYLRHPLVLTGRLLSGLAALASRRPRR